MRNPRNEPLGSPDIANRGAREDAPERRCVLSGRCDARDTLVRLALGPDGEVLPDALAKAPGRGAWIGVDREELRQAVASGKLKAALSRAFKTGALAIPPDLAERVDAALERLAPGSFQASVAGDEVQYGKPHPEPYQTACRKLAVDARQCVVFEDSGTGARSGNAAGAVVVAIEHMVPVPPAPRRVHVRSLADLDPASVARLLEQADERV